MPVFFFFLIWVLKVCAKAFTNFVIFLAPPCNPFWVPAATPPLQVRLRKVWCSEVEMLESDRGPHTVVHCIMENTMLWVYLLLGPWWNLSTLRRPHDNEKTILVGNMCCKILKSFIFQEHAHCLILGRYWWHCTYWYCRVNLHKLRRMKYEINSFINSELSDNFFWTVFWNVLHKGIMIRVL